MIRRFIPVCRVALVTALVSSVMASTTSPGAMVAHADSVPTWWVAASGTAADPATNGSSCANPSYVGATHTSIQAAITAASAGDVIKICSGTYAIGTTLTVDKDLLLVGSGDTLPVLDGGSATRIMNLGTGSTTVFVEKLRFENGKVDEDDVRGGAINVNPDANLNVSDSYFLNNVSVKNHGGAIGLVGQLNGSNSGSIHVDRSTFVRNSAVDGGAIAVVGNKAESVVSNSTFIANYASRNGGAVNGSFANFKANNSTFLDNKAPEAGDNSWNVAINGSLIAYSPDVTHNTDVCVFDSGDPVGNVADNTSCLASGETAVTYASLQLGFLAPWGGSTYTVSIGATSSARDKVATASCSEFDQRGESRSGTTCDAGAFEYQSGGASITPSSEVTLLKNRAISPAVTFATSGMTAPLTYRVVTDLSDSFPAGVTFSSSTGQISGTPSAGSSAKYILVSATDSAGKVTSAKVTVNNCLLSQSDGAYSVGTPAELEIFGVGGCGWESTYKQTADIALSGTWVSGTTSAVPFKGTYDGGGHSITGLRIDGAQMALISFTQGATIRNLRFDATISGGYDSVGLVSLAKGTSISGIRGTGSVSIPASATAPGCIAGIVGELYEGSSLTNSSFEGNVTGTTSDWAGGLVGCSDWSTITGSYYKGTVTGRTDVGGIVGWAGHTEITNSYATGSVVGSDTDAAGLVGFLDADSDDEDTYTISNSYSSMTVQGVTSVGALVGAGQYNSIAPTTFWEAGLAGIAGLNPIGHMHDEYPTQPALSATPTASMKSHSFFNTAGWSITNGWEDSATSFSIWGICDGKDRPFLLWQYSSTPCTASEEPGGGSTTTVPTSTTISVTNPPVSAGGVVTIVGGEAVKSSIKWSGKTKVVGKIGTVSMTLGFGASSVSSKQKAALKAGAPFTLSVSGLKPRSKTTATIVSAKKSIGKFTVTSTGKLKVLSALPKSVRSGDHKVRITMVNKSGKTVTVWLGIKITAAAKASLRTN